MRVRLVVIGLAALTMTSTALALSCAFPTETATLVFDSAVIDGEVSDDDLQVNELRAFGPDYVVLTLDDADGFEISIGLERVAGAQ